MTDFESRGKMTIGNKTTAKIRRPACAGVLLFSMTFGGLLLAGCGGSTPSTAPASANDIVYTYQGVENVVPATENAAVYIPFWTFVLGQTESSFRYNGPNNGQTVSVIAGAYTSDNGYLALTGPGQPFAAQGYALTLPGEAALLRPGNSTTPPVIAADMTGCPVAQSSESFLFVALPGAYWTSTGSAAYGSVQASTDGTGTNWNFSSQSQSLLAGSGSPPFYPMSFAGTCGQGISGWSIGAIPTTTAPYNNATISVSPDGFFTESAAGQHTGSQFGADFAQPPFVGVVAPSSALDTTSLAAAKYLGFMYEVLPNTPSVNQNLTTQIVSFGSAVAGSGTTMTGGVFANDDPSQAPAANITVNFGSQSASQNGLYIGVTVTIPDTTTIAGTCANNGGIPGKSASGSPTCSFPAVAVAGNPQNKFAVFVIGQDPTQQAPFGLYLYQQ